MEAELLYLIVRYLSSKPRLDGCAKLLQQQLESDKVFGSVVGWNGVPRSGSMMDISNKYPGVPQDQLVRLLKTPLSQTSTSANTSLLRRISGFYLNWLAEHKAKSTQCSKTLAENLVAIRRCLFDIQSLRQTRAVLITSASLANLSLGDDGGPLLPKKSPSKANDDPSSFIDLSDSPQGIDLESSPSMQGILKEIGKAKELHNVEMQLASKQGKLEDLRKVLVVNESNVREAGFALAGLNRGNIDCGMDWITGRSYGLQGRNRAFDGPLSRNLQVSGIKAWQKLAHNYRKLLTVSGHMLNPAYCSIFDHTGRYILTGADDYLVKIWSVEDGLLVHTCKGHQGYISFIAISPDNSIFASACTYGGIRIWRMSDGKCLHVLQHGACVNWLKFDPTTGALASVSDDGQCIVWDISKIINSDLLDSPLLNCSKVVKYGQEIVPGATGLFYWSRAGESNAQPLNMLELPHLQELTMSTQEEAMKVLCLDVSSMGKILVTGCEDGVARVWRFDQEKHRYGIREPRRPVESILPILRSNVTPQEYAKYERVANHLLLRLEGHVSGVTDVQFNSLGDRVLTGSAQDGSVRIWSMSRDYTKYVQIILDLNEEDEEPVVIISSRQRGRNNAAKERSKIQVYNACWTLDDLRVITAQSVPKASGGSEVMQPTRLKIWDSMNGDLLRVIWNVSDTSNRCLIRHPFKSSIIITAGEDGYVNVWDIDCEHSVHKELILSDDGKAALIVDVSISFDGSYIAATDALGRLTLLGLDHPSRYSQVASMYPDQYFSTDYANFILDDLGFAIDVGTQLPVNDAPVGSLVQTSGAAYAIQPKRLSGPAPLPNDEIMRNLLKIEHDRPLIVKELERVYNIFARNKSRGRIPRKYRQTDGPNRTKTTAAISKTNPGKPRSSNVHYVEFDINHYQPSSDDSALDSDWEFRGVHNEDDEQGGHVISSSSRSNRVRGNVRTLRDDSGPIRRSARARRNAPNYDDGDVRSLLDEDHFTATNTALTRAERAAARARRRGATVGVFSSDSNSSEGSDAESVEEEALSLESNDDVGSLGHSRTRRTNNSRGSSRGRRLGGRRAGRGRPPNSQITSNSLVDLPARPSERRVRGSSRTEWGVGNKGLRTIPLDIEVDRAWLKSDTQKESFYCPQLGDIVIYLTQGHKQHLQAFAEDTSPPWQSFPVKWQFVECEVKEIVYEFPTHAEFKKCPSVLAILTLSVTRIPLKTTISQNGQYIADLTEPRSTRHNVSKEIVFRVTLRNSHLPDFIVPSSLFQKSIYLPWHQGVLIQVEYKETQPDSFDMSFHPYPARVVKLSNADEEWPMSPWDALEIVWEENEENILNTAGNSIERICPWDAKPIYENSVSLLSRFKLPTIDPVHANKIEAAFGQLLESNYETYSPFEYAVDPTVYPSYNAIVKVPMYIDLIRTRLQNGYYRQIMSLEFDIDLIYCNCALYNYDESEIVLQAKELQEAMKHIVYTVLTEGQADFPSASSYPQNPIFSSRSSSALPSSQTSGKHHSDSEDHSPQFRRKRMRSTVPERAKEEPVLRISRSSTRHYQEIGRETRQRSQNGLRLALGSQSTRATRSVINRFGASAVEAEWEEEEEEEEARPATRRRVSNSLAEHCNNEDHGSRLILRSTRSTAEARGHSEAPSNLTLKLRRSSASQQQGQNDEESEEYDSSASEEGQEEEEGSDSEKSESDYSRADLRLRLKPSTKKPATRRNMRHEIEEEDQEEMEEEDRPSRRRAKSFERKTSESFSPIVSPVTRRTRNHTGESLLHIERDHNTAVAGRSRNGRSIKPPANYLEEIEAGQSSTSRRRSARNEGESDEEKRPILAHSRGRIDPELKREMMKVIEMAEKIDKKEMIFKDAVDVEDAPGYYDIVTRPMNFSAIRDKLCKRKYGTVDEVIEDVFLIYENCKMYNADDSYLFKEANRQKKQFESFLKENSLGMFSR